MPGPKDNAKASGDVHQPDLEELRRRGTNGQPVADDTEAAASQQDEARPGKGENQAGFLKDKDAPGMGSGGSKTR